MFLPVAVILAGLIVGGVCALVTGLIAVVWRTTLRSASSRASALTCGLIVPATLAFFGFFSNPNAMAGGFDNIPAAWLVSFFAAVSVPCCLAVSFLIMRRLKRG